MGTISPSNLNLTSIGQFSQTQYVGNGKNCAALLNAIERDPEIARSIFLSNPPNYDEYQLSTLSLVEIVKTLQEKAKKANRGSTLFIAVAEKILTDFFDKFSEEVNHLRWLGRISPKIAQMIFEKFLQQLSGHDIVFIANCNETAEIIFRDSKLYKEIPDSESKTPFNLNYLAKNYPAAVLASWDDPELRRQFAPDDILMLAKQVKYPALALAILRDEALCLKLKCCNPDYLFSINVAHFEQNFFNNFEQIYEAKRGSLANLFVAKLTQLTNEVKNASTEELTTRFYPTREALISKLEKICEPQKATSPFYQESA